MLALGLLLWGAAACGGTETVEPDETVSSSPIVPSPTTEAFESPLLPTATQQPPAATVSLGTPEAGFGGAKGVLVTYPSAWANQTLRVYFSPFYAVEKEDQGYFVLEPTIHPSTELDAGGSFGLTDIPAAKYVIVIGPTAQDALPISEGGRPQIFEIVEGVVLDIGEVHITQ